MDATTKYLSRKFQKEKLFSDYGNVSDFYSCSFKRDTSTMPLLFIRGLLLLACVSIIVASFVIIATEMTASVWFVFLTHWGLVLITVTCALGFFVSCKAHFVGHIDDSRGLPWYVRAYWVSYSTTTTIALFITIYFWSFINGNDFLDDIAHAYTPSPVLDVFTHLVNTVLMLVLLLTSRHPFNISHVFFPVSFGIIYALFSLIYYATGSRGPFNTGWIYPMLDWSKPGSTLLTSLVTAIGVVAVHALVVAVTAARDAVVKRMFKSHQRQTSKQARQTKYKKKY